MLCADCAAHPRAKRLFDLADRVPKSGPNAGLLALAKLDAKVLDGTSTPSALFAWYVLCLVEVARQFGLETTPVKVHDDLAEVLKAGDANPGNAPEAGVTQRERAVGTPRHTEATVRRGAAGLPSREVDRVQSSGVRVPEQPALSQHSDSIPPAEAARDAFREVVRLCQGAEERLQPIMRRQRETK